MAKKGQPFTYTYDITAIGATIKVPSKPRRTPRIDYKNIKTFRGGSCPLSSSLATIASLL